MTTTLDNTPQSIVRNAVQGFREAGQQRPDGKTLTAALLELERATKRTKQAMPVESLLGTWRLCFSAGKKAKFQSGEPVGSGFYVPNELNMGPLSIRFTGPARYPGKKNLLVFDFTQLQVRCFGLTVYRGEVGSQKRGDQSFADTAIAKLPFFAFFAATDDYIAARGRGGGLAIWINEKLGEE